MSDDGLGDPCVLLVGRDAPADLLKGGGDVDGGDVRVIESCAEVLDRLDTGAVDCVACTRDLPDGDGVELLERAGERAPGVGRVLLVEAGSTLDAELPEGVVVLTWSPSSQADGQPRLLARIRAVAAEASGASDERGTRPDGEQGYERGIAPDYETVIEEGAAGVVLIVGGTIRYANRELATMLGYDPEELIGTTLREVAVTADRTAVGKRIERLERDDAERLRFGFTGRRRDGSTVELEAHAGRIWLADEPAVAATVIDVSERIQRRALVTALHEASTELITAHDPDEIAEVAVRTANDVLNLPHAAVFIADDERVLQPVAITHISKEAMGEPPTFAYGEGIAGHAYALGETVVVNDAQADPRAHEDGSKVIRSYAVIPMSEHGVVTIASQDPADLDEFSVEVAELLAATVEASLDRVEREEELREREHELERQNERLKEFASIVSHDLRGPLNVVRGNIELAQEAGSDEYLEAADEAAARMGRLVEDVLELARQGEIVGTPEPVSLVAAARRAWQTVGCGTTPVRSSEANLTVTTDCRFAADPDRLTALLENLFRNSLEHASPEAEIEVGTIGGGAGFYVADNGPGIPPEEREQVFERGFTTSRDGTGFGLAIVEEIAVAHGWSVGISESDRGGARFEVLGIEGDEIEGREIEE